MYSASKRIPKEMFPTWFKLFCEFNGRFSSNPEETDGQIYLQYSFNTFEDYQLFNTTYKLISTPIIEVRRSKFRRRLSGAWKWIKGLFTEDRDKENTINRDTYKEFRLYMDDSWEH